MLSVLPALVLVLASVAGLPNVQATSAGSLSSSEELENSCSLGCAIGWDVEASSSSRGHDVGMLNDSKLETAWVAAEGRGLGESISFRFPARVFGELATVRFAGFMIIPGYAGSKARYREFARPKSLVIELNGKPMAVATIADRRADQYITLPDIDLKPGDQIAVRITGVYPSPNQRPVAITALVPAGAH